MKNSQETLVDLLGLAGQRSRLPIVDCCCSRDELDTVCSTVSDLSHISLSSLYSDVVEAERAQILEKFCHATSRWNQQATVELENDNDVGKEENTSHMIVVTDACLPLLALGESPISTYGIVINMVVGGEVAALRSMKKAAALSLLRRLS
ncbi:hypothetical protein RJ641_011341, partial [Dillenia turbinata]